MTNDENLADVIPFPGISLYYTKCCICQKEGAFEAYKIWADSLSKVYFYCNACKHNHPNGYNIDITEAPELSGANAIPKGVIEWAKD